jgi:hypothetical protein
MLKLDLITEISALSYGLMGYSKEKPWRLHILLLADQKSNCSCHAKHVKASDSEKE